MDESMRLSRHLFSSESVGMGHPDKVADQISDGVLDAIMAEDPMGRVACETLVSTGLVVVGGEITTGCYVDIPTVVRDTIRDIGYTDHDLGFHYEDCAVMSTIGPQSPDIDMGVSTGKGLHKEQGAGDQGIMFGYACTETPEFMPAPIMFAHRMMAKLHELRQSGEIEYLRPDGKGQVTVEYEEGTPVRIHTVVLSAQHSAGISHDQIEADLIEKCIKPVMPEEMLNERTIYHVNPTGSFVTGGPKGDCGVTGRKIIVDTYGGRGSHGGGAFSGKDCTKVDRTASYMARHCAKNVVAAGLAERCELQLAYAIGVARPLSIHVDTEGTAKIPEPKILELIEKHWDFRPAAMIERLNLRRPIYLETAKHGHFGRDLPNFTWEKLDMVDVLRKDAAV